MSSCLFNYSQENYTALHLAVESGQHEVVETLLGEGANVHIRGKDSLSSKYFKTKYKHYFLKTINNTITDYKYQIS